MMEVMDFPRPEFAEPPTDADRGTVELSILIPTYNEDACIAAVVREATCVLHGLGRRSRSSWRTTARPTGPRRA
jgi:hypothetical protein